VAAVLEQCRGVAADGGVVDCGDLLQQGALGREHIDRERCELLPGVLGLTQFGDRVVGDHRAIGLRVWW